MTANNEQRPGPGVKRLIILGPWLVALAAVALYGLTLNHWVTFGSLSCASQIMGWDWHPGPLAWRPHPQHPLFLILTFPLRGLPSGWRVLGLNVFTAACAALTLAILARSVQLLCHDRINEERRQERGEYALLSVWAAFLPAAFAVLLLATQMTFWENAVVGTGKMIDLLVFAFLILCLLEFRISQRERRLNLFAFVYGAGVSNNWGLVGFFPCFLLALSCLIWSKRIAISNREVEDCGSEGETLRKGIKLLFVTNWRFALRLTGWGALGLLFYGLIPLLGAARHDGRFWELLHQKFGEQHFFLTRIPWNFAAIAGLMTLVPLIFARIEWPSCEGDTSPGAGLTRILFRVLNLECLAVGLLMFFDVKIIPSLRSLGLGVTVGMPNFLSFYYLAALIVGYFSGCVLRVFGMNRPRHWLLSWSAPFALLRLAEMDGAPRLDLSTRISRVGNGVVVGLLWMAAIGLPAMLFRDNFPQIRDFNGPAVAEFGKEMAKGLPATPAIVLADDPDRLYLAMGSSQRLGLPGPYVFIERQALAHGEYLRYLAERYPAFHKELVNPDRVPETLSDQHIGVLLAHLARRQPVYYLHPSFGNSFEAVCMTPRRLGGDLHPCPANALATLVLTPEEIATNQAYWHAMEKETLASLPWLAKRSPDALQIANYYSQILDYWGTELQKTSTRRKLPLLLEDANAQFVEALRLKPNNLVAKANQQYNEHLRGVPPAGAQISTFFVAAQLYNRWDLALDVYGPADVPDLDIQIGRYCAQHDSRLQAAHLFQRSLELAPNNPVGELDLGNTYVDLGLVEAASDIIADMHKRSTGNRLAVVGAEALGFITKHDFAQADQLLADAHRENPADAGFTGVMAEIYRLMGDRVLRESKGDAARKKSAEKTAAIWFKKALTALDEHSQLLHASTANLQEITLVNLRRAEMQRMLAKD